MFDLDKLQAANDRRDLVYVPQDLWWPFMEACEALGIYWITGDVATQVCDRDEQLAVSEGNTILFQYQGGQMARCTGSSRASYHCDELMLKTDFNHIVDELSSMLD